MANPATYVLEDEIKAVEEALMGIHNSQWVSDGDDPRDLDPDEDMLSWMATAASDLEQAALNLQKAVSEERRRREAILDDMTEEEYAAWEQAVGY